MRPLSLLKIILAATVLASAPVIGAIAVYAQKARGLTPVTLNIGLGGPPPIAGQNVVSTDGERIGEVVGVTETNAGVVNEMRFKTGGFLGFGAKTIAVPAGRFAVSGQDVFINFSSREIQSLPDVTGS